MLVEPGTELAVKATDNGLVEICLKHRYGAWRSFFLNESQVNVLIVELSRAKKA